MLETGVLSPVQLVGYAAMAAKFLALACRSDRAMKAVMAGSLLLWAVHFYGLGVPSVFLTTGLLAGRQLCDVWRSKTSAVVLTYLDDFTYAGITVVMVLTWTGPSTLLPWLASATLAFAFATQKGIALRGWLALSMAFWLANGAYTGSIAGVTANLVSLGITGVTVARLWSIERAGRTTMAS
jgi:hypothetical protein